MKGLFARGLFITFEGGEGAGKTTLIERVYDYLKKKRHPVVKTRAPGGTPVGQEIRKLLLTQPKKGVIPPSSRCELLLFLADRAQHVDESILPALKAKQIVLCDRFNDSTMAYQGGARRFDPKLLHFLCSFASNELLPDLTFYLDLDPKIGLTRTQQARSGKDRIESEALRFHNNIRRAFRQIAKKEPERVMLIDASKTPEQVFQQAIEKIDALLPTHRK
jgi:dTMP kinase